MKTYRDLATFSKWTREEQDRYTIHVIKGLIMDGVRRADSGHTGGPMSSADFAYILFSQFLTFDPDDPQWFARDRFILSAGHESMLLYALLHLTGWLAMEDLEQFRRLGSRTPGHPEVATPGVEATTGPLGQGVGMGVGMALAEAILTTLFARVTEQAEELVGHYTYVLASDGDLQEPVALGAAALAGHWRLSKLIVYYDSNTVQISGSTHRSDSTEVATVFEGFHWQVQVVDGHDLAALRRAIRAARRSNQPSLIIGRTTMAAGAATMEGDAATHGAPLPQEEIDATKQKLGLAPEALTVPTVVRDHFRRRFGELREKVARWRQLLAEVSTRPEVHSLWQQVVEDQLPELELPHFESGTTLATRKAFGVTLEAFARQLPNLIGGSADLEPSNYTGGFARTYGDFQANHREGRNLAFGVREFPMAAILNGLALHGGMIPFGGTFLVFSDYCRPAIRLSALQKVRVIYEFTHDSFFVGEDGPTHQPVEQIMALRAVPNLIVFRPADARETAACFRQAVETRKTPSALLLSRQGLPVLDLPSDRIEAGVRRGGYVVRDCHGPPEIVLIATGSEVSLALEVARRMQDKRVRVVSLPSWELFDRQPEEYRTKLIPRRGCLKVSLEAGVGLGWERYVGPTGLIISLERFGASAPARDLAQAFGFTAEQVEQRIRDWIARLL
jgi:transketolase